MMKALFMGTPDFAVPCLQALCDVAEVVGVVTQPDRPKGRGQKMQPTPVKLEAEARGIPVYQPEKVKTDEFTSFLEKMAPDIIIVVAFGQILSQRILDIPKYGCVNVHASLLPRYRGAAPIHWAIINGETETGNTTMYMDKGLDTGDMLLKSHVDITDDMTTEELHDILMLQGGQLLKETVKQIEAGTIKREKQIDEHSCYARMLTKDTGHIDWNQPAQKIHNLIRGLNSWPGAWSIMNDKNFKIWKSRLSDLSTSGRPGEVVAATKHGLVVAAGEGCLEIIEIQPPGKKKMQAGDFMRGHGAAIGDVFH